MLCPIDSCQKSIRGLVSHDCIAGSSVQLIEVTCLVFFFFIEFSASQSLVLIDRRSRTKFVSLSKILCRVVSIASPGSFRFSEHNLK